MYVGKKTQVWLWCCGFNLPAPTNKHWYVAVSMQLVFTVWASMHTMVLDKIRKLALICSNSLDAQFRHKFLWLSAYWRRGVKRRRRSSLTASCLFRSCSRLHLLLFTSAVDVSRMFVCLHDIIAPSQYFCCDYLIYYWLLESLLLWVHVTLTAWIVDLIEKEKVYTLFKMLVP